jgi:hypothetical protein
MRSAVVGMLWRQQKPFVVAAATSRSRTQILCRQTTVCAGVRARFGSRLLENARRVQALPGLDHRARASYGANGFGQELTGGCSHVRRHSTSVAGAIIIVSSYGAPETSLEPNNVNGNVRTSILCNSSLCYNCYSKT